MLPGGRPGGRKPRRLDHTAEAGNAAICRQRPDPSEQLPLPEQKLLRPDGVADIEPERLATQGDGPAVTRRFLAGDAVDRKSVV